MSEQYEAVWIRWRDSSSRAGWHTAAITEEVLEIDSLGFMVEDHEDRVAIAQSHDNDNGDGKVAEILVIPRECIVGMWVVT